MKPYEITREEFDRLLREARESAEKAKKDGKPLYVMIDKKGKYSVPAPKESGDQ